MQPEFSNLRRPTGPPPLPPETQQRLQCPRCNSTNTKFCYYNNYSLSQPRYFCKSCRRYWTRDGAPLRNIPAALTQRPQALPLLPLTPPLPSYSPQRVPPSLNVDASESFTELLNSQGSGFPGLEFDFGSDLEVVGGVGAGQVAIGEDVELEEGSGFAWPELTVAAPEGLKKTGLDSSRPE